MKASIQRYLFKDYIYLVVFLIFTYIEHDGGRYLLEYMPETLNMLWIIVLLIYLLIPRYLYKGDYLKFAVFYALAIFLGIFIMETFLEEDGSFGDAFTWFAIEHEADDLFLSSAMIGALKLVVDYGKRQNRLIKLEKEHAESEIRFLKSQLNPHVLFNNLNNIYSFALHKSEHTPEMILKLADIMRYMLYESSQDRVKLKQELDYVRNYIELQKIQLEGRGEVIFEVEGDTESQEIAPMMLISFIENCFKHSAESKTDGLRIIIKLEVDEEHLELYTENGFEKRDSDPEELLGVGGIGLKNIQRRLELIYPEKHQLIIKELSELYIVSLSIDLT